MDIKKSKNSALGQRGLLAKLGFDLNENHRIEISLRQERHYGVRALRGLILHKDM